MDNNTIQIALNVATLLVGLWLIFFKSYFKERGKIVATKKDIKKITEKIETVKQQLHYSTQSKLSLKEEERNSIVTCFEKMQYWINGMREVDFSGLFTNDAEPLESIRANLQRRCSSFEAAEAMVLLYIDNEDFHRSLKELKSKVFALQKHSVQSTLKFQSEITIEYGNFDLNTMSREEYVEHKALVEKHVKFSNKYNDERLELIKALVPYNQSYRIESHSYLQNILTEQ